MAANNNTKTPTTGSNTPIQAQQDHITSIPRTNTHQSSRDSMRSKSVLDFSDISKGINQSMDDLGNEVDSYFTGPIDTSRHSKLPYFMRIRGSVTPGLILPMLFIAAWTVVIVVVSMNSHGYRLIIEPQLITVLGFLVGLALSFRSSTAYERYSEGRKYWSQLTLNARNLARLFWIHGKEREGELGVDDLLAKVTAVNLILAFCVSMKHKLRFEPEMNYPDLQDLIINLDTFAKQVHEEGGVPPRKEPGRFKQMMEHLGITFFTSNPNKRLKVYRAHGKHAGNLPYEIANYLSAYLDMIIKDGNLPIAGSQSMAMTYLSNMMDALTGCERILQTPLPLAYNIVISQITWLYVLFLPFQLVKTLTWVTIPAVLIAAYMILGLAAIGREIENPFGTDVNDLDLDRYCQSIAIELDILTSSPVPDRKDWCDIDTNKVMFPHSSEGFNSWKRKGVDHIRQELRQKPHRHLSLGTARQVNEMQMNQYREEQERKYEEAEEREKAEEEARKREERLKKQRDQNQTAAQPGTTNAAPDTGAGDAV